MKKFTSILLMLFFALSGLFAANMKGGEVFYLTPHTTWNSDNARYAIYFFNNSTGKNTWASMSKVEGESNLWTGTVPAGDWANLIFCRMNPSATTNGWGSGVYWGGQTQDLTWDGTNNWFKVDSSKDAWNKPAGTWSTYTPPTPDPEPEPEPEDPDTPVDPEPVMITLYYVNNQGWSSVNAYAWGENPIASWPGEAATKTDLTAKGYDVYSYTFDSSLAANIIFNGDGNQTADLEFDPATPYFYIDQWYASLEDIEATSVEELAAYNIYATDGTIYADCEFAIYNLGGIDVTAQNGSLEGNYVVKTQKGSLLISVW